ncbi:hypothetical protein TKK_0000500 [Trichogramma kaykai]
MSASDHPCKASSGDESDVSLHSPVSKQLKRAQENFDQKTEEEKLESSVENIDQKTEEGKNLESSVENIDQKIEEGENLESSVEDVVQTTKERENLENSVENVVQTTKEGENLEKSAEDKIKIERLKRKLENINSRRSQFVNITHGNTQKLREIANFVTVINKLNYFRVYLDLSETVTIIRSFVDCGFFAMSVDLDTSWCDEHALDTRNLQQCKILNGTSFYDLMKLPLYKARGQYGVRDFMITNKTTGWFCGEVAEKFEARLGGILLRSILQRWAARSLRKLSRGWLTDINCDMIVNTNLSNLDLYHICLAASI